MVKEETLQQRARVLLQRTGHRQKAGDQPKVSDDQDKDLSQGPARAAGGSLTETEAKKLANASEMAFKAMFDKPAVTSSLRGNRTISGRKVQSTAHITPSAMPFGFPNLDSNFKWQSGQQVRHQIQQKQQKQKRQMEQLKEVRQEQQEFKEKMEKMMHERQDGLGKKQEQEQELKQGKDKEKDQKKNREAQEKKPKEEKVKKQAEQDQENQEQTAQGDQPQEHREKAKKQDPEQILEPEKDPDQKPEQDVEEKPNQQKQPPQRPSVSLIPQPTVFNLFKEICPTTPGKEKESPQSQPQPQPEPELEPEPEPESETESEPEVESGCKYPVPELLRFRCSDKRFINIPSDLLFSYSDEMRLRQDVSDAPMELRTISSSTLMKVVFWMNRHRDENANEDANCGGACVGWMKAKETAPNENQNTQETSEEGRSGGGNAEPESTGSKGLSKPEKPDNPTGMKENILENDTNWEERLMGGELTGLVELILAAHYLGIDTLTSHAIKYFNDLMDERSRSEMLMMLKISDCLTEVRHSMEKHRPLLAEIMGDQAATSPYSLTPSSSSYSRPLSGLSSTPYSTCSPTTSINSLSTSAIDDDPEEAALDQAKEKDGASDGNSNAGSSKKRHSLQRPKPKR